jgi:branched-chain amino acid transport system substrate-binding protein
MTRITTRARSRRTGRAAYVVVVAAALLLDGTLSIGTAQDKILKIGVLGPMSGPAAPWGAELVRGVELRVEEINGAGGLKVGPDVYTLQLLPYDHKAQAAEAITVTNKLVSQQNVKYIIGNAIGATTTAAQTITEPSKVFFAFMSWGLKNLGPQKPYSFRTELSGLEVAEPFYRWIKETNPKIKRIATISPNDESGKDSNRTIGAAARELGFEVAADEYFERDTKDFYPLLTRVLSRKPELIDVGNSPPGSAGLLIKQLQELGYTGAKAWMAGVNADALVRISGKEAAEGTWSPWSLNFNGPDASPALRAFSQKFIKKYGDVPGSAAVANYVSLDVVTKAMQTAGSIDTDKVIETLTSGQYDTLRGPLVIGGKETYGIDRQFLTPVVISEIRNGQVVDVAQRLPKALQARKK